jgi:hypothetical protein
MRRREPIEGPISGEQRRFDLAGIDRNISAYAKYE